MYAYTYSNTDIALSLLHRGTGPRGGGEMMFNNSGDQLTSDLQTLKQLIPQYYGLEDIRDHYGDVGECGCVGVWSWVCECVY